MVSPHNPLESSIRKNQVIADCLTGDQSIDAPPIDASPKDNQITEEQTNQWRDTLTKILQYYADLPYCYGDLNNLLIISHDQNHFMLVNEGWEKHRRVYGTVVHAEIRNGKIWIHYDGIEDGITDTLVESGVPKNCIVLAFHPLHIRPHTGYAIA